MADYTPTTDFSAKDTLPTGDANKIIKGSDFDVEFEAIETAIATKVEASDISALSTVYQPLDAELTAVAGLTSAANKIPMFSGSGTATLLDFVDEDNMASNSATAVPSQQSVKAYVDALGVIASGTYTPTITAGTNTDSISIPSAWTYTRIGSVVHVFGEISIDPTSASTSTVFYLSTPVAAFFANTGDVSGIIQGASNAENGAGRVYADTANERLLISFVCGTGTSSANYSVIASFLI